MNLALEKGLSNLTSNFELSAKCLFKHITLMVNAMYKPKCNTAISNNAMAVVAEVLLR